MSKLEYAQSYRMDRQNKLDLGLNAPKVVYLSLLTIHLLIHHLLPLDGLEFKDKRILDTLLG